MRYATGLVEASKSIRGWEERGRFSRTCTGSPLLCVGVLIQGLEVPGMIRGQRRIPEELAGVLKRRESPSVLRIGVAMPQWIVMAWGRKTARGENDLAIRSL